MDSIDFMGPLKIAAVVLIVVGVAIGFVIGRLA